MSARLFSPIQEILKDAKKGKMFIWLMIEIERTR